eukprot:TRINITY_DN19888_c2_g1_i1.p1 TRINITY_DN19888_c2_g1~~TRINITY_DN19888_c2_g1_i1.p1  ORF type:complete len:407 (+),score=61.31 TRINITY_DN19888_c2_g1_i1:50-1222(+)
MQKYTIYPVKVPGRPDLFGSDTEGFEMSERYEIKGEKALGWGAFGCVAMGYDREKDMEVAVKKVKNVFQTEEKTKSCLREVAILKHFSCKVTRTYEDDDGAHGNILKILDILVPHGLYEHVYLITELYTTNLKNVLEEKWVLTEEHRALLIYQLLRGLKCIHSAGCVHRDIKPANLLIKEQDGTYYLSICDLGSGRGIDHPMMTNTRWVTTRWYVPPEALTRDDQLCPYGLEGSNLKKQELLRGIDLWSTGCVLAELVTGTEIFKDEKGPAAQLLLMSKLLGPPTVSFIEEYLTETSQEFINKILVDTEPPALSSHLGPSSSSVELNLVTQLLCWDPSLRTSVEKFISHEYFTREDFDYHDPEDEPGAELFDFDSLQGDPLERLKSFVGE